jgi:ribosome-associated protein
MKSEELLILVRQSLEDMKAQDVLELDVSEKSTVTDMMFIATGTSTQHIKSIAASVVLDVKKAGHAPLGVEGADGSEWVLVDLGDIVVHVMLAKTRDFYNLEKLWGTNAEDTSELESHVESKINHSLEG